MTAGYSASGKALATTANTNLISIRSTALVRARIREFHYFSEASTAFANPAIFLTTVVDTAGTAVVGQKNDPNSPTASCTVQTGPTGGTLAAVANRRGGSANTVGSGLMWIFDANDPLIVPLSLSMVFRNDGVIGPAISWVIVWDE